MSKYTTEVRFLCESAAGKTESKGFSSIAEILSVAAPRVFNFTFPIFDESYRLPLEIKILRHYYTREICEETVGLWKLRLQDKLNMIMPYYNQLYESELIKFNPLYDVDLTTEHSVIKQGENSNEEVGNTISNESVDSERSHSAESESSKSSNEKNVVDSERSHNAESESSKSSSENNVVDSVSFEGKQNDTTTTNTGHSATTGENKNENKYWSKASDKPNQTVTLEKDDTTTDKYSDTPQGSIQNVNVENNAYLTNVRIVNEGGKDTTTTTGENKNETEGEVTDKANNKEDVWTDNTETVKVGISGNANENVSSVKENEIIGTDSSSVSENESVSSAKENEIVGRDSSSVSENESKTKSNNVNVNKSNIGSMTNTEEYVEHVVGKRGSVSNAKLLKEFRDTFLNIDKMIIDELSTLFFGLW